MLEQAEDSLHGPLRDALKRREPSQSWAQITKQNNCVNAAGSTCCLLSVGRWTLRFGNTLLSLSEEHGPGQRDLCKVQKSDSPTWLLLQGSCIHVPVVSLLIAFLAGHGCEVSRQPAAMWPGFLLRAWALDKRPALVLRKPQVFLPEAFQQTFDQLADFQCIAEGVFTATYTAKSYQAVTASLWKPS